MKKFTFKGVLDGFRQSVQPQATRQEQEIQEQLKADHFTLKKTFRHGFPYSPTSFAFDPVQKILAIGDKSGYIRILGRPGVDAHAKHEGESECAVLFTQFLVNEGALVTVTADDTIHLWNIRQKTPRIVQSLKFQRERVTCIHLPVGSKWLYVGTEKGNIHVVHIDTFALSGYIINWNKAIEVVRTSHPGAVIALCDNPLDANKLLIAFECGLLVLWDLKAKCAEIRWQAAEAVKSLAWHYEGKYFVSSHTDGSICSWPTKPQAKPQSQVCPHAKPNKDGNAEKCKPIYKVDLKSSTTGETFTIFSGGMPSEKGSKSNCITVMVGKATTVLEMEHAVCDFITLCENPWPCETQEPYAIAVLLQYDLVLIDLLTPGFPCFESPYPMDLHESPVTCCTYLTDCPSDLVPAFYSVGRTTTSKKSCFSEREWPISGGEWSPASCSYSEIVITGHQDGSLKFWDSGAGTLQILYKLKTAKMFEKPRSHVAHSHPESDNPLAVHLIFLCSESRRLCVAGAMGQVMLFKFRKMESTSEVLVLEIPILYENFDDIYGTSPECDFLTGHQVQKTESSDSDKTTECSLKVRFGAQRKPPGFQSQLVCLTTGPNRRNVQVTSLCISSSYGLMAYGTEYGLVIIDIIQKICLLSVACPDLYGAHDPYSRTPKSPKRIENKEEQSRSPSSDQLNDTTSPDSPSLEFVPEASSTDPTDTTAIVGSRPTSPDPVVVNSSRETLISGSAAATAAMMAKSPQREDAAPKEMQDRRKSMSWKTFNLKRQLSKVNMKIGGMNVNTDLESLKNSSIFYTPKEASPDGVMPTPPPPPTEEETTAELKEDEALDDAEMAAAAAAAASSSPSPAVRGKFRSSTTDSPDDGALAPGGPRRVDFEQMTTTAAAVEVERPNNLPLAESQAPVPLKPVRQKFKEKARDQRLLSVPNIKYQPRDLRGGVRILKNDVSPLTSGGGGSGTTGSGGAGGVSGGASGGGGGKKIHKLDGTFSRSRSSSMSSIDMSSSESVTCLAFIESYAKRNDILTLVPTLWIGTSFGSILTLFITMPDRDVRKSQPVLITINGGPVVRLKGSITSMSFLDSYGSIIPYTFETWRDENKDKKDRTPTKSSSRTSPTFTPTTANTISNTSIAGGGGGGGASAGGAGGAAGGSAGAGSSAAGAGAGAGAAAAAAGGSGGPGASGSGGAATSGSAGGGGGGGGMSSSSASSSGISGSVSTGLETLTDRQYIVIASEKQTKVFDVANQCCINRIQLSEMDFAVKAETITMKDGSCLATYLSNGHLMVHSLPSLKLLLDTDFLPLMDLSFQTKCKQGIVDPMLSIWGQQIIVHEDTTQISKIFCFSHKGHGLYMASPTEIQKFTISSEFCQFILEMMGELYTVQEMPEQPKEGFFKGLFGGGAKLLDREELFGEQSGKANRSVARHIPGPNLEQLGQRASTAASEISRAHQLAMERGEKLNLLEERAERMANTAQDFSGTAHQLMLKYKDKKWYQL
ncbi:syntaxin-binding protein 5 isoform X1 [Drosophila serrata]|uniref:syntaxin-binding protein 5 isoform X1 n=1 Tax=Drosophila serrata TaxID=7274 RepID=UPI000A1D3A3B|nr:syntaxin-binding protein 5 isoform X1 [Drosophila serrata]XP_020801787.1 syntaxin-binding protein 5 isoform X1 [Drosophila serrata]XP_020801788.1 syntaxin-binding protein 5 isoform X1 [Drosophila serrata]XP_020801789.1 syntaxin-binding protein 5 isoform X1 [Drosophila serrata]